MKNLKVILGIAILHLFIGCQDVIDVDLPENEPRIILDAVIRIDESQDFSSVRIKASTTSSFFDSNQPATLSSLQISNEATGDFVLFGPDPSIPGRYIPVPAFGSPVNDMNQAATSFFTTEDPLTLTFTFEDQLFLATTTYVPTTPIDAIEQGDGSLFDDEDTEVVISFTDIPDQENYYVFDFDFGEFLGTEDTFYPGQEFQFSYFYSEALEAGDMVEISILGADEDFYNYINLLVEQSEAGDNPFQTPVTTVRGNYINVTNIDNTDVFDNVDDANNFALGYFAVVQEYKQSFIVE